MSPAPPINSVANTLGGEEIHEVWGANLEKEFAALVIAASPEGSVIALDVEFPGFLRQEPRSGARAVRYQVLRENVDRLRPIQFGVSVAGADGSLRGTWSFNLKFDVDSDLHTEKAIAFLRQAGLDFARHAKEGIEALALGKLLGDSILVGQHSRAPWWVTFAGFYDLGYLLKVLTCNQALPQNYGAFEINLSSYCPKRHELRDELPHGSLDSLARRHGLLRRGSAHTAGSDALLTLELFLTLLGNKVSMENHWWSPWINEENWSDASQQTWANPALGWAGLNGMTGAGMTGETINAINWDATSSPWESPTTSTTMWDITSNAVQLAAAQAAAHAAQQAHAAVAPR
jgi:CCR4-NOT transcription complex subunit 7/8